jgi:hypothetical protein
MSNEYSVQLYSLYINTDIATFGTLMNHICSKNGSFVSTWYLGNKIMKKAWYKTITFARIAILITTR